MDPIVKLLGYTPDADPSVLGVITNCNAVVPTIRGMRGAPSTASAGMATLASTCIGAALITKLDGTNRLFAGTGTKLYEQQSSVWGDVSRGATYTGTASTSRWRFAQQGNVSFAANGSDTVQASVSSGAFSCIGGAPIAAVVDVVNAFVFAANTSAGSNIIQWSAEGDYTSWAASISTGAGIDTLTTTPGAITAARRFGEQIIVYKKNSMYQGVYVGQPDIWEFKLIPGTAGALSQDAVVSIGTPENPKHIFMGEDDFYLYNGANPVPIGTNRVKEAVFGTLLQSRAYLVQALHDRKNTLVYFYYPTSDINQPDSCVVYNYRTDTWGRDDRRIEATCDYVAPAVTFDGLGSLYATFNDFPNLAFDVAFVGSTQTFPAIFNTSHVIQTLTGPCVGSSFTTGDIGDDEMVLTMTGVWPRFVTAPTSATLTNYYKMTSGGSLNIDATTSFDSTNGYFAFIREARWHRLQFNFTGDWEMQAFRPHVVEGGSY